MSDIQPLPIRLELEAPISDRRLLAEEAFDLLESKGEDETEMVGGFAYPIKVTDRVDAITKEEGELALRLRQYPSMDTDENGVVTGPSQRYYSIDLETGTFPPGVTIPDDDDFIWQTYLRIVVDAGKLDNVQVFGSDEVELQDEQIAHALWTIHYMRQEMRNGRFEAGICALAGTIIGRAQQVDEHDQVEFKSEDFLGLSFCSDCGVNVPCMHNPNTLN